MSTNVLRRVPDRSELLLQSPTFGFKMAVPPTDKDSELCVRMCQDLDAELQGHVFLRHLDSKACVRQIFTFPLWYPRRMTEYPTIDTGEQSLMA
jgi:hypothetical protein